MFQWMAPHEGVAGTAQIRVSELFFKGEKDMKLWVRKAGLDLRGVRGRNAGR